MRCTNFPSHEHPPHAVTYSQDSRSATKYHCPDVPAARSMTAHRFTGSQRASRMPKGDDTLVAGVASKVKPEFYNSEREHSLYMFLKRALIAPLFPPAQSLSVKSTPVVRELSLQLDAHLVHVALVVGSMATATTPMTQVEVHNQPDSESDQSLAIASRTGRSV